MISLFFFLRNLILELSSTLIVTHLLYYLSFITYAHKIIVSNIDTHKPISKPSPFTILLFFVLSCHITIPHYFSSLCLTILIIFIFFFYFLYLDVVKDLYHRKDLGSKVENANKAYIALFERMLSEVLLLQRSKFNVRKKYKFLYANDY